MRLTPTERDRLLILPVRNTATVPISVSSHFHFFEANARLAFDRAAAYGMRLAVPAGSTVRFDSGSTVFVELAPIGGARVAIGFAGLVDGPLGAPGDPNASTDRCEPLLLGPQFGAYGATAADLSVAFVAEAAVQNGDQMPTRRRRVAVRGTRGIGPGGMLRNARTGTVDVHPGTGPVSLDGEPLVSAPAGAVSPGRLHFL